MTTENSEPKQATHLFSKGHSGNPAGRPKGVRHKAVEALDVLGRNAGKEIVEAVILAAKGGDARCAEMVLRRIWPEVKGRPISLDLPPVDDAAGVVKALQQISNALAAGEISPDEAQAVAGIVEGQRRAIETGDLERRIADIEQRIAGTQK
jgi:hypothetical protein